MKLKVLFASIAAVVLILSGCGAAEPDAPPAADVPADGQALAGDHITTDKGDLIIHPINHATFAMSWDGKTVYVDPVGGAARFEGMPRPDLILITDIHGDHLDAATLEAVATDSTVIVAPAAVVGQLPEALAVKAQTLANGEQTALLDLTVDAIPMYNLTADRLQYHDKGRGNGYVVGVGGTRVYISGDTEDIPEMRDLKDIDVAFVCFNLPYTMTEQQAADAVNAFQPKIVYPYHYMGSDVEAFKSMVKEGTEVRMGTWY